MRLGHNLVAGFVMATAMCWSGVHAPAAAQGAQARAQNMSQIVAELRAFEVAHAKAIDAKNIDAILGFYAPNLITVTPGEPILRGRDWIRSTMEELYRAYDFHETFALGDVQLLGDRVVATLEYTQHMTPLVGGSPTVETGKGICILRRAGDKKWQFEWNAYGPDPKVPPRTN